MRRIDETERPMPEINLAKVCFIIEKSREYLGEDVGVDPDDSNPTDDGERVMLTDAAGPSIRRELIEFIRDLGRRRGRGAGRAGLDRARRFRAR